MLTECFPVALVERALARIPAQPRHLQIVSGGSRQALLEAERNALKEARKS